MPVTTIRPATIADVSFMWEMQFESAFTTDEARASWRSDPQHPPELMKYLDGWGRDGDAGVIADDADGRSIGAAWYRLFGAHDRGDGIMAEQNVPELAIAVEPEHRGRRVGAALLEALARRAREGGYAHLLLSVDPANARARRLYERIGFVTVETDDPARGTSLIKRLTL
jgi:ribosomal protein S18 acetylase RimI-like enzyme